MEKELKSCMDILLRADITGRGHPSPLCQNRWDGRAIKRTPMQDFESFPIMFYFIISTKYQKNGDLLCPVIFLDFCTVCIYIVPHFMDHFSTAIPRPQLQSPVANPSCRPLPETFHAWFPSLLKREA